MHFFLRLIAAVILALSPWFSTAAPPRQVYAHYMVCCTLEQVDASVDQLADEIALARRYGIDGFALNIGAWSKEPLYRRVTDRMFEAARRYPEFKLFLSVEDITPDEAVDMLQRYARQPNYLKMGGKLFMSTWASKPPWEEAFRKKVAAAHLPMLFIANRYPLEGSSPETPDLPTYLKMFQQSRPDGFFYFGAAGTGDQIAQSSLAAAAAAHLSGILYMAPVTPYYLGHGVNNRVFDNGGFAAMEAEWKAAIAGRAQWVEIVTWNDYEETSYVRPFGSPAVRPEGQWLPLLPHDGFLNASLPFIQWFKTGRLPPVSADRIHVFYRPRPSADCALHTRREVSPCPTGHESLVDRLYLFVEARRPTRIIVRSGDRTTTIDVPAGRTQRDAPLAPGTLSIDSISQGRTRTWTAPLGFGGDGPGHDMMYSWSF